MLTVEKFSQQLFWDVRPEAVDLSANKRWFIARVLEYGKLEDWKNLVSIYSRAEIIEVALSLRTLDAKTFAFLCVIGSAGCARAWCPKRPSGVFTPIRTFSTRSQETCFRHQRADCGLSSKCRAIISGDLDLTVLGQVEEIDIVTPSEFWRFEAENTDQWVKI